MTSSNPNSPTNSPLNFRPFAIGKRGQKFRFIPTNSVGLSKPVITQALQTGGDAIQVTWGESGGTSYALQVSTNGGTTFSDVTTTAATSFTHTGLSFPGSYTYRVRATVDAEVSDWSDSVTETMVDVPAAPGGLTVTGATTSSISLSWNDTADEGSYLVEVSVDGLGSWTSAGSTNQNVVTFTHSGLAESVQRHYRVTAFNKAGGSIPSSTANSWTVPAAPTGLTATAISTTQIDLSWTDVSTGNQSYKVERSTDNVNWTEIATGLSATATTYSATGLSGATQYWFRVRAANAARNSDYSSTATATTTLAAPSGLTATATSSTQINLSWTDNSANEDGFKVERSTDNSTWTEIAGNVAANSTTYSATGLTASTLYYFRVRAYRGAVNSSYTSSASATTQSGSSNYSVSYLVIGGGAGGGTTNSGGGGGAGGYRNSYSTETSGGGASTESPLTLTPGTSYTITVGAGGAAATNGNDSVFGSITSTGGGKGANGNTTNNGSSGGSGGGAQGLGVGTAGAGTANQGYGGGGAGKSNPYGGGGGGGAGAAGAAGTNNPGGSPGNGGNGLASSITGTSITRAGGGGGGAWDGGTFTGGANGTGGGGTANTGGGGNGTGNWSTNLYRNAAAGGSGVVIIRMATANYSGTTTGSPTVTTSGSDTILTYNASGTYTA